MVIVYFVRVDFFDGTSVQESYFDFAEANSSFWEWTHCCNCKSVFLDVSVNMIRHDNEVNDYED